MPQPFVLVPPEGSEPADEWVKLGVQAQLAAQTDPDAGRRGTKFADAERHYRQALRLNPRHAIATQNLAVLFAQVNQLNEGLLTIERAAMFDGVHAVIHTNRAFMCLEADRLEEALASARHAVDITNRAKKPDDYGYLASRLALAMICPQAGLPEEAVTVYREMLAKDPKHPVAATNACFVQTLTGVGPKELLEQRKVWYEANKFTGQKKPHTNDRRSDRPLRVGYVSGDFKKHSASMIFAGVITNHDPAAVTPFFYSTLPVDPAADHMTKRFKDAVGITQTDFCGGKAELVDAGHERNRWRDIETLTDEQADDLIRKDQIDILVDLSGHTNGGRLTLFCRKPAPVQVTAWGFAHGTGCETIDYFFADPVAVPEAERQYYAEKIIDLPCIVTYDPPPPEYGVKGKSPLPYHRNEFITFGAYARYEKFCDECLAAFAEILRKVPDSKLEFKDHAFRRPFSIKRILAAMPDIAPERLLFSISTNHQEHMMAYQSCDLILNPFPHSGGLVSVEQLWMGVPYVTLRGTQAAGRTGASVLTAMGRADWIAETPQEYIEKAVALANDIPTLNKVRKTLRDELLNSPVVKGYRAAVETAYKAMWKEWCK